MSNLNQLIVYESQISACEKAAARALEFAKKNELLTDSLRRNLSPKLLFTQCVIESLLLRQLSRQANTVFAAVPLVKDIPLQRFHRVLTDHFKNLNILVADIGLNMRFKEGSLFALSSIERTWTDPEGGWIDMRKVKCRWENAKIVYSEK